MQDSMDKQMAFQAKNQRAMLEKQIVMQQLIQQRQMAMQIAKSREMFNWIGAFGATVTVALTAAAAKKKNPVILSPLLPLAFGVGYFYDMAHGSKMRRIRRDGTQMIVEQDSILMMPNGAVTLEEVEEKIMQD